MRVNESKVVHLDHHIKRQSIRFYNKDESASSLSNNQRLSDTNIRYNDIISNWFENIRKPDFQRETNAWSSIQCTEFIDSVVKGQIIPSIILWKNEENGLVYVLDGAHRLSIIRGWMEDDYGDKNLEYYERRDIDTIKKVCNETRDLINSKIGSFEEFKKSYNLLQKKIAEGKAPKAEMNTKKFLQATFYSDVISGNAALFAQWERGNYESAEQSFLRINRQGQPLAPAESTLIEYRRGSYSRVIMHIANAGEAGYYWPLDFKNDNLQDTVNSFNELAKSIYERLFIPSFSLPIKDLSVPLLVAPAYFQKHNYLMELIPLLYWGTVSDDQEQQIDYLSSDHKLDSDEIVNNADKMLKVIDYKVSHITSYNNDPRSLSIVPLFYWYNERGQFIRSLFYSWVYWLFKGSDEDVFERKIIYTSNRENIESIFFHFKKEISVYAAKSGAGLKAVRQLSIFYEKLINYFHERKDEKIYFEDLEEIIPDLLNQKRQSKSIKRSGRTTTLRDKTQSNINELFVSSIKCHICGGIVDLKFGGIQYDHVQKYKQVKETDPENLKPTHPFCNNNRDKIESYRKGEIIVERPMMNFENTKSNIEFNSEKQLSLFELDYPK